MTDPVDLRILRVLADDARIPNNALAARVGIAPSTCLERVRSLRERGVILGYHAQISSAALNRGVQAFLSVRIRPKSRTVIDSFKAAVIDLPEVIAVFVVAGDEDFLIHVAVQDLDHLHAFLTDRLAKRREVVSFRSQIVYQSTEKQVREVLAAP